MLNDSTASPYPHWGLWEGRARIGFAKSAAGEYTFSIFAVVSIAVVASWFVAVLFIPLLGVAFLSPPHTAQRTEPSAAIRVFRRILVAAMRMRWITILVTLACFVISLLAFPHVPRQFFPSSDRPELLVDLRLPQNASIYASSDRSAKLDEISSRAEVRLQAFPSDLALRTRLRANPKDQQSNSTETSRALVGDQLNRYLSF